MPQHNSRWRFVANFLTGRDSGVTREGPVTTRYGHQIILPLATLEINGAWSANIDEFMCQPRVHQLELQMAPLLQAAVGDRIALRATTGQFYLESHIKSLGRQAVPLGRIDMALETTLFEVAARHVSIRKMSCGKGYENPVIIDESSSEQAPIPERSVGGVTRMLTKLLWG